MVTNYVQHKLTLLLLALHSVFFLFQHFFTPFSACGVLSSHFLPRPSSPLFFRGASNKSTEAEVAMEMEMRRRMKRSRKRCEKTSEKR